MDPALCGFYDNRKGVLGYYATFQSPKSFDGVNHWYMLARSNDRRTLYRMHDSQNISAELMDVINYLEQQQNRR